ncbi:Neuroligin-1 [Papilio machaon]|uniref:Neuroligin-1 n=1 Tax=Papilio machaon TaxID=76193 RepID=A0A194R713_PAPMA|nr:Neuroligin-1 [Papilio machaon]
MERACSRTAWCAALAVALLSALAGAGPRYSSRIVHTAAGTCTRHTTHARLSVDPWRRGDRVVCTGAIRGIIVEPASRRLEPVEVFRGVPYAAPPARLAAPAPAPRWPGTRLADAFAPVCPQRYPDISNKSAALMRMPLAEYIELRATAPLLANQSEDCLYLNIFVPGSGARGEEAPYAVLVWAGAARAWGSGNAVDGAVLAARAHLLVVTLNYRIGLLEGSAFGYLRSYCAGYLTSGGEDAPSVAGGAGVLDAAAALRWVRDNIAPFGGDPRRVTLAGHGAAAVLVNTLLMLPQAKGLVSRALLLSGSALAPGALAPDAGLAREHVAQALRCPRDANAATDQHWLTACVRARPLAALLAVEAPRARFLAGWAPGVPRAPHGRRTPAARALHASDAFLECALAVVVATTESYQYFSEDDIRHGFEEEHRFVALPILIHKDFGTKELKCKRITCSSVDGVARNRVLRTYVRNVYRYHRNEIFAAIRNEYTDWERPIQHPINIRDATLEALSDGAGAAPALRLAQLHARRGATTYFAHFTHQTRDADYPQRLGSVSGETLPYFLGLPLVGGMPFYPRNYSRGDVAVAEAAVALLAAFAKTGHPAPPAPGAPPGPEALVPAPSAALAPPAPLVPDGRGEHAVTWPRYELNTQQYLSIGGPDSIVTYYLLI